MPPGGVTQLFGASLSVTVIIKLQLAVLPDPSVAVQFTVVAPLENVAPDGGTQTTVGVENASVASAVKFTTVEHAPGSALRVMSAGQLIIGGSESTTVTLKLLVRVLPAASVAILLTMVVPSGKDEPDGGLVTTVTAEQSSLASTIKLTTAEP
jgi:hypothetical protein